MKDRLLIVDDEQDFIMLLKIQLEKAGYMVESAMNGKGAVDAYTLSLSEDRPISLIILDMLLPDINGMEVARMIRDKETQKSIEGKRSASIILLTGNDRSWMDPSENIDIDSYLLKPVGFPELLKLIEEQLKVKKGIHLKESS